MKKPIEIANTIANLITRREGDVLARICVTLCKYLSAQVASIYNNEPAGYRLVANRGFDETFVGNLVIEKNLGLVSHIVKTRRALALRKATSHRAFFYVRGLKEEMLHGLLGVPVFRDGDVIGVLMIQFRAEHDCSVEEIALMETVAQQVSGLVRKTIPDARPEPEIKTHIDGHAIVSGLFSGPVLRKLFLDDLLGVQNERGPDQGGFCYETEKNRLNLARKECISLIETLVSSTENNEVQQILSTHLTMLCDPLWLEKENQALKGGSSAEQAVALTTRDISKSFEKVKDPYIRQRAHDVMDIGRRLYNNLSPQADPDKKSDVSSVCIASGLPPSVLAESGRKSFGALILVDESIYSHSIILARSMGIPTVVITGEQLNAIIGAQKLLVDGERGVIFINPSPIWEENYRKSHVETDSLDLDFKKLPCVSLNGTNISLGVNGAFLRDVENLPEWIPEVGLFRTEFQYFLSPKLLTEKELYDNYRAILGAMKKRPITLRILDIGGDKRPPYMELTQEENPILGVRSIRYLMQHSDIIITQLRAMLRANVDVGGNLRILVPMVTIHEEVSRIRDHVVKVIRDLRQEGLKAEMPPFGVMIEVPSSIYAIPRLQSLVDFFCVGTNDLLQYLMAAERNNPKLGYLYNWHHPTFLIAMQEIVKNCEGISRPVSVCGEMASELWGGLILLGLGYRSLSMDRRKLARHHELVRAVDLRKLKRLLKSLMACEHSLELLGKMQLFLDSWKGCPRNIKDILEFELANMLSSA
ncbi:MAG: phosphoenolpyruvate--protein phosphotransferase [Planctomycetes bacterium]|nr:phosphoenolpyruvate--protein phosphotransferase [Planctomycetota bacterium]